MQHWLDTLYTLWTTAFSVGFASSNLSNRSPQAEWFARSTAVPSFYVILQWRYRCLQPI